MVAALFVIVTILDRLEQSGSVVGVVPVVDGRYSTCGIRTGKNASVAEVVRDALEEKKRAALSEAIDHGLAELDAGLGVDCSPAQLMNEARAEAGLIPS